MAANASSAAGLDIQWAQCWVPCPAPCPGGSASSGHESCIGRCSQSAAYCEADSKLIEPIRYELLYTMHKKGKKPLTVTVIGFQIEKAFLKYDYALMS